MLAPDGAAPPARGAPTGDARFAAMPISVLSVVGVACVCGSGPVTHFEGARYRVVPVRVALLPSPSEGPLCQL